MSSVMVTWTHGPIRVRKALDSPQALETRGAFLKLLIECIAPHGSPPPAFLVTEGSLLTEDVP